MVFILLPTEIAQFPQTHPTTPRSRPMRIGWCCKFLPPPGDPRLATALNLRDTTVAALSRLSPAQATEKLLVDGI